MKSSRRQLESRWRKNQSVQNLTAVKTSTRRSTNTLQLVEKAFNIEIISEAMNWQELFWVICYLTNHGYSWHNYDHFTYNQFAAFFKSKIEVIQAELDPTSSVADWAVVTAVPFPSA